MKSITIRTLLALAIMIGAILFTSSLTAESFTDHSKGSGAVITPGLER